ncbi:MAG TPA: ligase-associated DNA damage response exonuclease [Burkholderiaceae bacterium]|nr:ligase-associated DNA damage response exonuclease [Burkholderiaceae bacterium]
MTGAVVVRTPQGLYCPAGDFHIDPWRKVERAVITHAHADHARTGHGRYLCARRGVGVLRARLGAIEVQGLAWNERLELGEATVSLHPAGHILGSAQVRIEVDGEVWVVAGDYHLSVQGDTNPTCDPFEAVPCHVFVTEATFGLPIYRWPRHSQVFGAIDAWWRANAAAGEASFVGAYSLGKTQHVLAGVDASLGPLYVHPAAEAINAAHVAEGIALPLVRPWRELERPGSLRGALIVAPPGAQAPWRWQRDVRVRESFASGWMLQHAARHRTGLDRGFVLSDHADWPGLLAAVAATGCERVVITHGDDAVLGPVLAQRGLEVGSFRTTFGTDAVT